MDEIQEDDDEQEVQEIRQIKSAKRPSSTSESSIPLTMLRPDKKGQNVKGPMDLLLLKNCEATMKLGKPHRQTSINDACDKEARARTI